MGFIRIVGRRRQEEDTWFPCDYCSGAGIDMSRDNEPTERGHLNGETPSMAYRGYIPTNTCEVCGGEGGAWLPKARNVTPPCPIIFHPDYPGFSHPLWRAWVDREWSEDKPEWSDFKSAPEKWGVAV